MNPNDNMEIKVFEFDEIKFEVHTKFKDAEVDIFRKGQKIIESCLTYDQLNSATKFVELIGKNYIGVSNALIYLVESKRIDIRIFNLDINNTNVIFEEVTKEVE